MKKVYYFLFAAMGLASCSNEDVFEAPTNVNEDIAQEFNVNKRSYSEVLEIAQNSISMIQDSTAITRGESGRTLNLESGVKTYCQKTTRANGASVNDTLLYVFNFNDNKGFAVVSANRATEGLLAIVEEGNYDPNSKWGDSYAEEILENAKEYVANAELENQPAVTRGLHASSSTGQVWIDTLEIKNVKPRIKVKWAQKGEIAKYSLNPNSNKIAGSGPIAIAQVMSYWGAYVGSAKSTKINLQYRSGVLSLDWKKINSWSNSDKISSDSPKKGVTSDAVAQLVREIAYRAKAKYWNDQTETSMYDLRDASISLGFYATSVEKFYPSASWNLIRRLWADNFAIMEAANSKKSGRKHIFIIDGFQYKKEHEYIKWKNEKGEWEYLPGIGESYRDTELNYINWGEAGKYDGYYTSNLFNPSVRDNNGRSTDYFENWKGGTYNTDMKVFIFYWNR